MISCPRSASFKSTVSNGHHKLNDCHCDHLLALSEGSSRNVRERGRDVNLQEALFMEGLFCCGFNLVNDSHFRFSMHQPADSSVWSSSINNSPTRTCTLRIWRSMRPSQCFFSVSILKWCLPASKWRYFPGKCLHSHFAGCGDHGQKIFNKKLPFRFRCVSTRELL